MPGKAPSALTWFFFDLYRKNEAHLHELSYLFWECTRRCTLACLHCGSDCSASPGAPDPSFDTFVDAVKPLIGRYGRERITVVITGGEPLLREDLADAGRRLRALGFRWGVVTNGVLLTPIRFRQLMGAGMGAMTVSLDGLETTHDWLRGQPGCFAAACDAVRLAAASPRLAFDVVTCVTPRCLDELPRVHSLLASLGARAWRLFTIAPIGRAAGPDRSDLLLNGAELRRLLDFIAAVRAAPGPVRASFSCEAYTGGWEGRVRDGFFFCRAGTHIASVLADGSIAACPNIDRAFVQGSIHHDDFLDVWDHRFAVMRDRRWTRTGICADCRDYGRCRGGAMHLRDAARQGVLACAHRAVTAAGRA